MIVTRNDVCKCDLCGHQWLPAGPGLPKRCAKCKSWKWNSTNRTVSVSTKIVESHNGTVAAPTSKDAFAAAKAR